jgi:hypothetical protein
MGTRGIVQITYKGKTYSWYNHFDSYLAYLGKLLLEEMIAELENNENLDAWRRDVERLEEVDVPTDGKEVDRPRGRIGYETPTRTFKHVLTHGSYHENFGDFCTEYVYNLDLDTNSFTVNGDLWGFHKERAEADDSFAMNPAFLRDLAANWATSEPS